MYKLSDISHPNAMIKFLVEHVTEPGDVTTSTGGGVETEFPLHYVMLVENRKRLGLHDPWKLRGEFLGCRPEDWRWFIYLTGDFGESQVSESRFAEWQRLVRAALIHPAREWEKLKSEFPASKVDRLVAPLPFNVEWRVAPPTATIRAKTALQAIIATIQI